MNPTLQETVNKVTSSFSGPVGQSMVPAPVQGPVQPSEPAMISSSQGKTVVDNATQTLNTLKGVGLEPMEPSKPEAPKPVTTPPINNNTVTLINPETGQEKTLKGEAINEMAMNALKEQGYQESTSEISTPEKDKAITDAETAMQTAKTTLDDAMSLLESTAISSAELRAQTREIKRMYSARMKKMEDTNRRRQQTMNTLGIRLGSRYTGGSAGTFGSILAEEERQGLQRINEIEGQMMKAISDAEKAVREHNYGVYVKQVELAKAAYDEKLIAFSELEEAQKKADAELEEEAKTVEDQASVIEQVTAGETDPFKIFTALGGKVSFDVIKEMTDTIPGGGDPFTLGKDEIRYDAEGNVIARGSNVGAGGGTGSADGSGGIGGIVPVGAPVVAGLGSSYKTSGFEAQMMIDDIMNKIPVQLRNNVAEVPILKEQIRKQLQAGYSYQSIVDRLSGFSLQGTADKALGNALYNASLGTDMDMGQLASLLNRGANEQAMTTIENKQLESVNAFFAPVDKARATIKQADVVLSLLNDPTFPKDSLGAFDGRSFKVTKWFGLDDEETRKVQQLETALQLLASPIRVEIAGTAATDSEMGKISAFQADILDQPEILKTKVTELRNAVVGFHNEARSQRGLPTVNEKQLINNKERLQLYRSIPTQEKVQSYSTASNADLLGTGSAVSSDPNGIY